MRKRDIAIGDCKSSVVSTLLKDVLDNNPQVQKHLFEKGYLITDDVVATPLEYPFYGNWLKTTIGGYYFWIHKESKLYTCDFEDGTIFLIGHAYNPYTMEAEEELLLKKLADVYGTDLFMDTLDELTGIFIMGVVKNSELELVLDASGMQYGCYGTVNGKQYISSHMRLVGDICGLTTDPYVKRLVNYRWYRYMMGNYLPGNITCYRQLKRIVPNTYVTFRGGEYTVKRFYPNRPIAMCQTDAEYRQVIEKAAHILKKSMVLISRKWERPAISLTGGVDSNTTFAAANGCYGDYETFSYVSMYRESVDAEMAEQISRRFGVKHTTYIVPEKNDEIPDFSIYKAVFEYNQGGIGVAKDDDTRKKVVLIQTDVCDVEVKSWVSETIRGYAYKYFGRKKFPNDLKARHYTSLYKIFFMNRRLVWETDRYFKSYFESTQLKTHLFNYDESDFFVWEMMHGGKCGLNIGVMKSCFDITIPYNNRKLLDLLLRVPLSKRISDQHHMDLKQFMNKELYDMKIRVVNLNETKKRKMMANFYFTINSILPF